MKDRGYIAQQFLNCPVLEESDSIEKGNKGKDMTLLEVHKKLGEKIMAVFRWDLQLHFFWGFTLTLLGVYCGMALIEEFSGS